MSPSGATTSTGPPDALATSPLCLDSQHHPSLLTSQHFSSLLPLRFAIQCLSVRSHTSYCFVRPPRTSLRTPALPITSCQSPAAPHRFIGRPAFLSPLRFATEHLSLRHITIRHLVSVPNKSRSHPAPLTTSFRRTFLVLPPKHTPAPPEPPTTSFYRPSGSSRRFAIHHSFSGSSRPQGFSITSSRRPAPLLVTQPFHRFLSPHSTRVHLTESFAWHLCSYSIISYMACFTSERSEHLAAPTSSYRVARRGAYLC